MSEEAIIQDDLTAKESRFGALKTAILVVLGLLIIGIVSSTILYFTNSGVKTNWIDEITQYAPIYNNNLSISGSTPNVSYYLSGGLLNQKGVIYKLDILAMEPKPTLKRTRM